MSDDWEVLCSDDEKYDLKLRENGKWEPPPEEILRIYEELAKSEETILDLSWTCPGRRAPTPEQTEEEVKEKCTVEDKPQEKDEYFDFEVEKGQLCLRPLGDVGPRGSAKKKTTSLDAILSNMARHRRMDMMDEDPK
ncbi:PTIP binding protein Pa1 [Rhodnius prolixus]